VESVTDNRILTFNPLHASTELQRTRFAPRR
jgi:hypothetical protein